MFTNSLTECKVTHTLASGPHAQKYEDKTLYRNYVSKWKFLIQEYELVKQKRHPKFRFAADFYRFHRRQTFFVLSCQSPTTPWSRKSAGRSGKAAGSTSILSNKYSRAGRIAMTSSWRRN